MKSHILARHCRNLHNHCPKVVDSWCHHQPDKANEANKYKARAGLLDTIIAKVKPVYARPSNDVKKCLQGKPQNAKSH